MKDWDDRESARGKRACDVATGRARCGEGVAFPAVLINDQPVEVETAVNVVFTLGR